MLTLTTSRFAYVVFPWSRDNWYQFSNATNYNNHHHHHEARFFNQCTPKNILLKWLQNVGKVPPTIFLYAYQRPTNNYHGCERALDGDAYCTADNIVSSHWGGEAQLHRL